MLVNHENFVAGDIPAATAEDIDIAVEAARRALIRNGGKDWAAASGAHRAKFLRAIAAKVKNLIVVSSFCLEWNDAKD